MKILILCDHYPLSPRVKKVRESILKYQKNATILVCVWNREHKSIEEDYVCSFNQEIGYGKKTRKFLNLINFIKYSKKIVKDFEPNYIHCIDFEMLFTGVVIGRGKEKIYEVYDIKFISNKLLNSLREFIEFNLINSSTSNLLLASPYFKKYYNKKIKNINTFILNNKPSNQVNYFENFDYIRPYSLKLDNKVVIGFIGTVRYKEILINLLNAVNKLSNVIILIAGSGPDLLSIKNYVEENSMEDMVVFTGRYNQSDMASIYSVCNCVWAAYPNKDSNVRYAISNKYFESALFNKKIIVSEDTFLGEEVVKENRGYTVNPYSTLEIMLLINKIVKNNNTDEILNGVPHNFWEDEEYILTEIYT